MTTVRSLLRDPRAVAGVVLLGVFGCSALLAPLIASADPLAQPNVLGMRSLAPLTRGMHGSLHLLGTDALGRDLFSRLVYGARISLTVGILAMVVSFLLGVGIGVAAAMAGGVVDRLLMALTDAALALPRVVLLLALVSLWEQSLTLVVMVLGVTGWMGIARLVRAEVRSVQQRPFVEAARAAGAGPLRMLRIHLLPNAWTPVIVASALGVGNAIMMEAGLSFLGLGVPAPAPSWGNMIASGRDALVNAPWISTLPGIAVALTVVASNLLGDALRDSLDPSTRRTA